MKNVGVGSCPLFWLLLKENIIPIGLRIPPPFCTPLDTNVDHYR